MNDFSYASSSQRATPRHGVFYVDFMSVPLALAVRSGSTPVTLRRPRRPRSVSAVEFHLANWARIICAAERLRTRVDAWCDLSCECRESGFESRDQLEAIIRRGGRSGHRVAQAIKPLDDRFERATLPRKNSASARAWWYDRQ